MTARIRASMRPGQTAPECVVQPLGPGEALKASMRPGQTAPECMLRHRCLPIV